MRVYIPGTVPLLRRWFAAATIEVVRHAHAVTPALRSWFGDADTEELEYAAMVAASEDSLRLLAAHPQAPRRRVVLAADVPLAVTAPAGGDNSLSAVLMPGSLRWDAVVSAHVDEPAAGAVVTAAAAAVEQADAGDEPAQLVVDDAEAHDLMWYDVQEVGALVGELNPHNLS